MSYNKIKALTDNVRAIETAVRIRRQRRQATVQEKETLSMFTGFGGIKEVLNIGTDKPIPNGLAEPIERLQGALRQLADGNELHYQSLTDGIKSSVLTAFYTPQFLIDAVARLIQSTFTPNDIPMRTFLEPSAGIGGFLPVAQPDTRRFAFEKDEVTGLILSLLHENTKVCVSGFETIAEQGLDSKTFDVIASNIPFGNFRVFDAEMWKKGGIYEQAAKTIHNYFFVKAMELLSEGGILAFVTSRGVADTTGNKFVRDYLVNHANLITALRLPDNLFIETGGIEVGSDLLIFQKNTRKATLSQRERLFLQVSKEVVDMQGTTTDYANKLFTLPNHTLSTDSKIALNQYGKHARKYHWQGDTISMAKRLADILKTDFDRYYRKSLFANITVR